MKAIRHTLLILAMTAGISVAAAAQDSYVTGFGGVTFRTDSMNSGAFTSDFTTGEGTTIPAS